MSDLEAVINLGVRGKGVLPSDLSRVVAAIPTFDDETLRRAILVTGYNFDPKYQKIIEPYPSYKQDVLVVVEALDVLTRRVGLALEYMDFIEKGLAGFEWDVADLVQDGCMTSAAYVLRQQPHHKKLVQYIYSQLLDNTEEMPSVYAADAAQIALGATSRERAFTPFEGPPDLAKMFHDRFLGEQAVPEV